MLLIDDEVHTFFFLSYFCLYAFGCCFVFPLDEPFVVDLISNCVENKKNRTKKKYSEIFGSMCNVPLAHNHRNIPSICIEKYISVSERARACVDVCVHNFNYPPDFE